MTQLKNNLRSHINVIPHSIDGTLTQINANTENQWENSKPALNPKWKILLIIEKEDSLVRELEHTNTFGKELVNENRQSLPNQVE